MDRLRSMPDNHYDCVVTSPPYWGLRDYGVVGQIGLEPTLGEHLSVMVAVFEEIRRVLKKSGTCWINYGDCYATSPNGRSAADTKKLSDDDRTFRDKPFSTVGPIYDANYRKRTTGWIQAQRREDSGGRVVAGGVLKPKDLCMVPNRLAIALQDAGWWVRSEIIWGKSNPMPESVFDRPATSHEKIWMLTKSAKYFYDAEAVRAQMKDSSLSRLAQDVDAQEGGHRANGGAKTNGTMKAVGGSRRSDKQRGHSRKHAGFNDRWDSMTKEEQSEGGRNLRNYEPAPLNVWRMATRPFKEAHFATFPAELAHRCIMAGCPPGGLVLDPFGGAGTTGMAAAHLQRKCDLIELNPAYALIAADRLRYSFGMLYSVEIFAGDLFAETAE